MNKKLEWYYNYRYRTVTILITTKNGENVTQEEIQIPYDLILLWGKELK